MTTHELKTWPIYFEPVLKKEKTMELRKNDRDYKIGDLLKLREYDAEKEEYTGRYTLRIITHIVGEQPFVPEGYVAMSIK